MSEPLDETVPTEAESDVDISDTSSRIPLSESVKVACGTPSDP